MRSPNGTVQGEFLYFGRGPNVHKRDDFVDRVYLFQIWEKLDCLVLVGMITYLRLKEETRLLYDGQKVSMQFKKTYKSSENQVKW